jgi:hypothetical protein
MHHCIFLLSHLSLVPCSFFLVSVNIGISIFLAANLFCNSSYLLEMPHTFQVTKVVCPDILNHFSLFLFGQNFVYPAVCPVLLTPII